MPKRACSYDMILQFQATYKRSVAYNRRLMRGAHGVMDIMVRVALLKPSKKEKKKQASRREIIKT